MLWDAVTTGEFLFADGTIVKIDSVKDWFELVRFISSHVDGPAVQENNLTQVNIYKVYNGIDESRI